MSGEINILKIVEGIYDIQPPVHPALSGLETTLLATLYITLISLTVYLIWKIFYSIKKRAQRKIEKLHVKYSESVLTDHDVIYQLCFILQRGLKLNCLGQNTPLPEKLVAKKEDWTIFTENISVLRYKNKDKSEQDINALFKNSLFWLKIWP